MISNNSNCQYLFGKSEEAIFNTKRFIKPFIDQCLDTLMRLHTYLFGEKDAFFLINPAAFNDQCHLYGLRAAQVKREYSKKTDEEKQAKTEENRFLHLSVFLSFTFLLNSKLYGQVAEKNLEKMGIELPQPKKKFLLFCKDPDGNRVRAARDAFNAVYKTHITKILTEQKELSVLNKELFTLFTTEELDVPPKRGKGMYYTPPKLAGVAYMVDILQKEDIVCALKVKVITEEGTGSFTFINGTPQEDDPVLIFETIATDGSYSVSDCRTLAKRCPSYHRRNPSSKQRHPSEAVCLFCNPEEINLDLHISRVAEAGEKPEEMFYALGADYVQETQKNFLKFFNNDEKYPVLSNIFRQAVPKIDELGLSMHRPLTFSIAFVYTDHGAFARSGQMLMDRPYEEHLKKRAIL